MDWQQIEENWARFKQAIRGKWGKLSEDDLESIAGRRKRLEETLHKRYGFAPDHVRKEVDDWLRWQTSNRESALNQTAPTDSDHT